MAHLTVLSFSKTIEVHFGMFAPMVGYNEATFHKANVSFQYQYAEPFVRVESIDGGAWTVTDLASAAANPDMEALIIDSIDGIPPTDLADLYLKLKTLIRTY